VSEESEPQPTEPTGPARRGRRERTAVESLVVITLSMEAIVVVFGMLAINGLNVVPAAAVFGAGAALVVLLLVGVRVARYRWGVWYTGVLQVLLLATGIIEVLAAVTAAIFVGFWIYAVVRGRQLEAGKRAAQS
jgi:hypothetical protein